MFPDVKAMIDRPFEVKLEETKGIVRRRLYQLAGRSAVSFSGGKDSQLVLYLCRKVDPSIAVVFNNTGVEYPETRKFVEQLRSSWDLDLTITKPEKSFWECVDQYGFPTFKDKKRCCYWLKEKPMLLAIRQHGWIAVFDGVTAAESRQRQFVASKKGTCYLFKHWGVHKIHPILWWTEDEVFDYLTAEGLTINPIYATGQRRVGCLPCTAHKLWESQLSRRNPKLYREVKLRKDHQYVMDKVF